SRLIRGWNEGWFTLPQRVGVKIAQLIGAQPDEVIAADSTSVNFFKLIVAALRARPTRSKIVTDDLNFPSDVYLLQGAIDLLGQRHRLHILHSEDGLTIPTEQVCDAIDGDTALVTLTYTAFKSGYVYDMAAITEAAHRAGALMLWDLSHSIGALPLELNKCNVDLAVGCTYKYLNGGPGALAFLFVRKDLQDELLNPIWGWFGQQGQFDFQLQYQPARGITRWQAGTPNILSLSAVEPALDLMLEAGIDRLRAKSIAQTEYLIGLYDELLQPLGVTLNSPRDHRQRGSHVSIGHAEALRIDRALIEDLKVIPDFRYPDNIRLGIAPIYTSFTDIHEGISRIRRAIADRLYEKYPSERPDVT
ncbi:MAG TPA: aminotransferase class V-fold PLP-dependent enzyme, partial [Anaerolineae bacterium]|nr:aminotransferase class V-fold PLP-dependent enzyme [Anaerolineae bacterium]